MSQPCSPLTGTENVSVVREIDVDFLVKEWKRQLDIEVAEELAPHKTITLYQCEDTSLRFFRPVDTAGSGKLYEQLQQYAWYYMADKWEYREALKWFSAEEKTLEIGCGSGAFIALANAEKIHIEGNELNPEAVRVAQSKGFAVTGDSLEELAAQNVTYDNVCNFQVLEHIAEPLPFLQQSVALLRPGGQMVIGVPNGEGFLKHLESIQDMPPHHMLQWTQAAFKSLESILPVKLEEVKYEPLAFYHVKGYVDGYCKYYSKQGFFGKLFSSLPFRYFYYFFLLIGFRKFLNGHTFLVNFRKTAA